MQGFIYNPADDGKPDFQTKICVKQPTFSS
jgi:hypothetical protein